METAGKIKDPRNADDATPDIAELYETHYAHVYRAALRITGNPADAEDVLQTVFFRVLGTSTQGEEWSAVCNPEAWFRRAACNAAIDVLRRRMARAEVPVDDVSLELAIKPTALLKEQLRGAIAALDAEDAELFSMRYIEGFSNGELADIFQQEKNNIAVRLHRIRQLLQMELNGGL